MGDGKTSVRASVGLFSNAQYVDLPAQVSQNLPFLVVQTISQPPHDLTNPYQGTLTFPPVSSTGFTTNPDFFTPFLPTAGYGWSPNYRQPRITTMTLNLERQIAKDLMVEVGYVGKLSRHLATTSDINTAQKIVPGLTPSVGNEPLRRLLDGVNFQKIDYEQSNGNASYNAFQATLRYRAVRGLTLLTAYTWSHSIDTYSTIGVQCACYQNPEDPLADRGSSDFDQRHVLAVSAVYDLPDAGKSLNSRLASHVLGGWELSAIVSAQTGTPFTVYTGIDASLTAAGADRPDLVGNPFFSGNRSRAQEIAAYINPNAFQINNGHFGNLGRNTFTNPGLFNSDIGLSKNIPLERVTLQFRTEFFNAFNQTHLGSPNNTFVSPTFGQIVSAGDPRLIQFALKLAW